MVPISSSPTHEYTTYLVLVLLITKTPTQKKYSWYPCYTLSKHPQRRIILGTRGTHKSHPHTRRNTHTEEQRAITVSQTHTALVLVVPVVPICSLHIYCLNSWYPWYPFLPSSPLLHTAQVVVVLLVPVYLLHTTHVLVVTTLGTLVPLVPVFIPPHSQSPSLEIYSSYSWYPWYPFSSITQHRLTWKVH